jgi:hypothetical protein
MERTVWGIGLVFGLCWAVVDEVGDVDVDGDEGVGVGVGVGVCVGVVLGWPNSWANFTSFQMPTEELTIKVVAKVVMPAMAWSIFGYHLLRMVSEALAVAKVAV